MASGLGLSFAAGCGPGLAASEASDLRHRLDEQKREATAQARKLDELEDRIFLLTDQIESQKVAASRRGAPPVPAGMPVTSTLPVVTLRPNVAADERVDEIGPDGEEIEFRGAATSRNAARVRPMLSGDGSLGGSTAPTTPSTKKSRPSAPPVEVPNHHDNLGVAAAPPITAAGRRTVDSAPAVAAPSNDDPLRLYREAQNELRAGHHDAAEKMFRDFVKRFAHHDYADNAQYWLGECFYARKRYAEAAGEFQMVLATYPTGNKAPDAMLKLAYCLIAMGDESRGRDMLGKLPEAYPRTEAARLAAEKMAELSTAPKESSR